MRESGCMLSGLLLLCCVMHVCPVYKYPGNALTVCHAVLYQYPGIELITRDETPSARHTKYTCVCV
jgi:hypothetical protein